MQLPRPQEVDVHPVITHPGAGEGPKVQVLSAIHLVAGVQLAILHICCLWDAVQVPAPHVPFSQLPDEQFPGPGVGTGVAPPPPPPPPPPGGGVAVSNGQQPPALLHG